MTSIPVPPVATPNEPTEPPRPLPQRSASAQVLIEQALSRAAGAPLLGGNAIELLIDAAAHYAAWLDAIRGAQQSVLLENYMIRDDAVGREFRDALIERAHQGVRVAVICDWMGCLGQSGAAFWKPLRAAGGQVHVFNPPQLGKPFGWIRRDHRKLLVVDHRLGFLSGVCINERWLGDPQRGIPPWRDTGVALRGPAVAELVRSFAYGWAGFGAPLPAVAQDIVSADAIGQAEPEHGGGDVALRVIATEPSTAGLYRLDQQIAAMARQTLWLTDAYFVGVAPYVQSLAAAAGDGVDVRLLVPGTSDIPMVAGMSRAGYRPLLKAGIRVFEWNGSMLHAKTAVADGQWARVGSSNLNIASWLGNREIDVSVEDTGFAQQLASQYLRDLENATEIVLAPRRRRPHVEHVQSSTARPARPRGAGGTSSRAAAGALRIANTVGAALTDRRVLGDTASGPLWVGMAVLITFAAITLLWPHAVAWPLGVMALWFALNLAIRQWRQHRRDTRKVCENAD